MAPPAVRSMVSGRRATALVLVVLAGCSAPDDAEVEPEEAVSWHDSIHTLRLDQFRTDDVSTLPDNENCLWLVAEGPMRFRPGTLSAEWTSQSPGSGRLVAKALKPPPLLEQWVSEAQGSPLHFDFDFGSDLLEAGEKRMVWLELGDSGASVAQPVHLTLAFGYVGTAPTLLPSSCA